MTSQLEISDREVTALADLTVTAPPSLRTSVLVEVGLVDRYGRVELAAGSGGRSPGTGSASSRSTSPAKTGHSRPAIWPPRADEPSRPRYRSAWPTRSPGDSTAIAACASGSTCAGTARSSRTSGGRRSRSLVARSGRTAGSRRRSAGRRRSGRSVRPSATTPFRSSSRVTGSYAATGRSASTLSAGPKTSGPS